MISNKKGFTLIELLVVVGMIAVIMGAMTTSVTASQERARKQKATAEVKVIAQAILAYENYAKGNYSDSDSYKLEPMGAFGKGGVDADKDSLGFLLGNNEKARSDGNIPALLMASLQAGGKMKDPWGTPYKIYIRQGAKTIPKVSSSLQIRCNLPNFHRLGEKEREL